MDKFCLCRGGMEHNNRRMTFYHDGNRVTSSRRLKSDRLLNRSIERSNIVSLGSLWILLAKKCTVLIGVPSGVNLKLILNTWCSPCKMMVHSLIERAAVQVLLL